MSPIAPANSVNTDHREQAEKSEHQRPAFSGFISAKAIAAPTGIQAKW